MQRKITFVLAAYFLVLSGMLIYILLPRQSTPKKITVVKVQNKKEAEKKSLDIVKIVYANSVIVNADKVFSYPSSGITLAVKGKPKKEVVGFLPYWMLHRVDDIDFENITSVNLFGIDLDHQGNIVTANGDSIGNPGWVMWNDKKLNSVIDQLKRKRIAVNLTLKLFDNWQIEQLVSSDEAQKKTIANAIYLINSKNLDGINIDFEYIGTPPGQVKDNFTRLITNLRAEMKNQIPNSQLTIDTYLTSGAIPGIFDVASLAEKTDALIIMGYDVHTLKGSPGPISPMEGGYGMIGLVQSYLEKVPEDKIIIAFPYYGYDWSESGNSIKTYAEIQVAVSEKQIQWNDISQTPWYSYIDSSGFRHEVHFENVRSLAIKYDYVNRKNLKGVGIWALGYNGYSRDLEQLIVNKFSN